MDDDIGIASDPLLQQKEGAVQEVFLLYFLSCSCLSFVVSWGSGVKVAGMYGSFAKSAGWLFGILCL